ncbi:MAG: hypothetical protein E6Q97_14820 [Desulfurellales bacterium]|nr:MAG: hypothetical protein E6Q97_14820 [Desulfurellales bacterium]
MKTISPFMYFFLRYFWRNHLSFDLQAGGDMSFCRSARFRGNIYILKSGIIPANNRRPIWEFTK